MNELVLDRYRLIERLAVGGTAEVWRAHDEQLDRPVAVKRLHPHLMPDIASRKRLAAEARAAAGLSHPVIVGVYDVDADGEAPALVMELVDGESLATRIDRDGPLPVAEAVAITAEVADALYHAHQRGVIHRDVKPGNVLLARDGRTRLVDFGIAHSLAASAERLTLIGTVIGTLHAMAPEQLAAGPITPRTDLYGLGVVLHEALTGQPPYASPSPVALADAQRAGRPSLDGIEPALAAMVRSCLAFDPADRPVHAGALAAALRAWRSGDTASAVIAAFDTGAVTQPIAAVAAAAPTVSDSSDGPRPRRAMPLAALAFAALLAAVVAGAMILSGIGRDTPGVGAGASPTASPPPTSPLTPAPPPPTPPEWLADLVEDVAEVCGDAIALEVELDLASLSEDDAEELVDELIDECDEDPPGGGRRRGGGNNNGNGSDNDD